MTPSPSPPRLVDLLEDVAPDVLARPNLESGESMPTLAFGICTPDLKISPPRARSLRASAICSPAKQTSKHGSTSPVPSRGPQRTATPCRDIPVPSTRPRPPADDPAAAVGRTNDA
jgi:hypothetical protein